VHFFVRIVSCFEQLGRAKRNDKGFGGRTPDAELARRAAAGPTAKQSDYATCAGSPRPRPLAALKRKQVIGKVRRRLWQQFRTHAMSGSARVGAQRDSRSKLARLDEAASALQQALVLVAWLMSGACVALWRLLGSIPKDMTALSTDAI
jgi:hypothetical protein